MSTPALPTMHGVKDHLTESIVLLILCCSLVQTVEIWFQTTTDVTITEGSRVIRNVCHDSSVPTSNAISFSVSASPVTSVLTLPRNPFIPARSGTCITVTIESMDNFVREDTRTFQISLSSTFADVDENQGQFFVNVRDVGFISGDSCPTPTVINSSPVSCDSFSSGSVCSYDCNSGFERLSGDTSRTCTGSSTWDGLPLFCIPGIDECSQGQLNFCNTITSECVNTPGDYFCHCKSGYSGMIYYPSRGESSTCEDIDECSPGQVHSCDTITSECMDTAGDYFCSCKFGYSGMIYFPSRGDPSTCEDIDECSRGQVHSCNTITSECVNTPGDYFCSCKPGYSGMIYYPSRGESSTCEDDVPPTITNCPTSPIFVYVPTGQMQGEATWTEPMATDVSGEVIVSQTHYPGDTFPEGTTPVRYDFSDVFSNKIECQFAVSVFTVAITCPQPITISYGDQLSFATPQCIHFIGSTPQTSPSSCTLQNGMRAEEDVLGVCSCIIAPHISCTFQVTVTTKVQCPLSKTISHGEMLSYNIPQCMNNQGSHPASCVPSTGSPVTTDTSITCTCSQDSSIQCSFQIFVDCTVLRLRVCMTPGVSCDCVDESFDPDTGICSSNCIIVNTCPASIESKSLSQVNPSSSVNISCTLRGSTTILQRLQLRLSSKLDSLDDNGITRLTGNGVNTGDKVVSTARVENVSKEQTLFCVLLQGTYLIGGVTVKKFLHELPVLNAAPSSENVSNTSVTISWRAWDPAIDDGDPPIVAYIPYYRIDASDELTSGPKILANKTLQFKADNLEVDTLYVFSVAAVREGENGEGRRSSSMKVKTLCNVPDAVASVNVELTSSNKVNVSWQLPLGAVMCSTGVKSYNVYYRIEDSIDDTPQLAGTVEDVDTRWFIVDDGLLQPESSYIFFVTVTTDQESGFRESQAIEAPAPPPGSLVGIIVAVISIVFLLIILLLVVLLLIRRKRDKEAGNNTPVPKPVDNTYDNPVFGIPDVHSRQDAEPAKAAEPVPQMQPSVREDYENKSVENLSIEKESSPDDVIYGNLEQPKPIRVAEFGEYFRQNVDKFDHEFSILEGSKKQFDWTAAEDPANKKKNRFKSMYTYDHSRVVLRDLPDQEGSDYYNASFIKDTNDVIAYIASQAPNRASLEDFVRMIWEQHVTTIVMVANLYEEGKERCLQYWPENEGGSTSFGSVTVTWLKTTQFSDFVIRYFTFKRGKDTREVQQLHFLTWPDKDTPEHGTALIEFTKQSKILHRGKKFPMLVHCSAGIGRTGTFICLNCMMDVLRDEEYIDVFGFVNKIRQNRINMVQTSKQYVFLYKCLNEYYLTHQTEMSVSQMTRLNVESHRGILLGEFELLSELGHNHRKDTVKNCVGKKKENIARNRVRNMVPSNRNRVFLMSPGQSNEKDYINASYVKSFQKKDAFITTQSPLPSTIEDFWRMVYDVKSPLIVMLNQLDPTDKTCVQYWPDRGSSEYGNMYVTCVATERQSDYTQRTFEVKHVNLKDVLSVIHLQMEEWRPDINLQSIVGLIKDIDMMQKRGQYSQPIVIHCINGFERSGVVVTVKSELERIAVTERIDVFSTVKKLRDQHEHMLKNKDDYILCYHLLKAYVAISNRNYENSEDLRRGGGMKSK